MEFGSLDNNFFLGYFTQVLSHIHTPQEWFHFSLVCKGFAALCSRQEEQERGKREFAVSARQWLAKFGLSCPYPKVMDDKVPDIYSNAVILPNGLLHDLEGCPSITTWERASIGKELIINMGRQTGVRDKGSSLIFIPPFECHYQMVRNVLIMKAGSDEKASATVFCNMSHADITMITGFSCDYCRKVHHFIKQESRIEDSGWVYRKTCFATCYTIEYRRFGLIHIPYQNWKALRWSGRLARLVVNYAKESPRWKNAEECKRLKI